MLARDFNRKFSLVLALGPLLALSGSSSAGQALQSADSSPVVFCISEDYRQCMKGGCELRVYDPISGESTRILSVPEYPDDIVWGEDFRRIYYRLKDRIYRAPWKVEAEAEEILTLPFERPFMGPTWWDPERRTWRMVSVDIVGGEKAQLWEKRQGEEEWRIAEERTTQCEIDGGPCGRELLNLPESVTSLDEEIRRAGPEAHPDYPAIMTCDEEKMTYVPSTQVKGRGLMFRCIHYVSLEVPPAHYILLPPLYYASEGRRILGTILEDSDEHEFSFSYQELGGLLLAQGLSTKIVDMKTGETIRQFSEPLVMPLLVPAPKTQGF